MGRGSLLKEGLIFLLLSGYCGLAADDWRAKVDANLLRQAEVGPVPFLVFLERQADLTRAGELRTKEEKGRFVFERLVAVAESSQRGLRRELTEMGVPHRWFWIANMILVEGDEPVLAALAQRPEVARVLANPTVSIDPLPPVVEGDPSYEGAVEPNIAVVGAPDVWALGYTGQGVVIGGHDTGYDWDHPGLIDQYRGWNGVQADHNYHWHDAIHSGGGICGPDSPEPCDDHSHGSHTMGTMVGADSGANLVGMAPGAKWIGCRNMNVGNGTPASYSECFQWFLAPTDLNGQNPDPGMAPHIVNNSWGCPAFEGCTDPLVLQTVVQNVRAAGIFVVVAAGNSGSGCGSISTPPAIYDASFTVAAVSNANQIASFSSRGVVSVDGSQRLKPDIAAPGVGIRSTVLNGNYGFKSGTSMAAPHVAGLAALLISAQPELAGDVEALESIMVETALGLTSNQDCGGIDGNEIPNPVFGNGRIRALDAVLLAIGAVPFDCGDLGHLMESWTQAIDSFNDLNGNGILDVAEIAALFPCKIIQPF